MEIEIKLLEEEIGIAALCELSPAAGSRIVFTGCVRNHDQGKTVTHLEYSAHPQAEYFLTTAVETALEICKYPQIEQIRVYHRIGSLKIGEVALLVVVDSAHRQEGFALSAQIVDQIKATVPIWKKQFYTDGEYSWSNCP